MWYRNNRQIIGFNVPGLSNRLKLSLTYLAKSYIHWLFVLPAIGLCFSIGWVDKRKRITLRLTSCVKSPWRKDTKSWQYSNALTCTILAIDTVYLCLKGYHHEHSLGHWKIHSFPKPGRNYKCAQKWRSDTLGHA